MVKVITIDHLVEDLPNRYTDKQVLKEIRMMIERDPLNLDGYLIECKNRSHSLKRWRFLKEQLPNYNVTRVYDGDTYLVSVRDKIKYEAV